MWLVGIVDFKIQPLVKNKNSCVHKCQMTEIFNVETHELEFHLTVQRTSFTS